MKTTRRILSMFFALVMIFSLSVTAFATENAATLNITVDGDLYIPASISSGISVKDALESNLDLEADFGNPFTDLNGNEAYALVSLMEFGAAPDDGPSSGVDAEAWSTLNAGYGLVGTDVDASGKTTYTYVYVGHDWMYSVENAAGESVDVSSLYMNQYIIQDGDTVTVDYGQQNVTWTTTDPILTTYPYI